MKIRKPYEKYDHLQPVEQFVQALKDEMIILRNKMENRCKIRGNNKAVTLKQIETYKHIIDITDVSTNIYEVADIIYSGLKSIPSLEDCNNYQIGANLAYTKALNICNDIVNEIAYKR